METYKIDYCNGFFSTVDADNLRDAAQKAVNSATHTQCNIKIRDKNYNTLAISRWFGVPPEEWDKPILTIGGGFYDGFVDAVTGDYI